MPDPRKLVILEIGGRFTFKHLLNFYPVAEIKFSNRRHHSPSPAAFYNFANKSANHPSGGITSRGVQGVNNEKGRL